jgi:hypothetical protein
MINHKMKQKQWTMVIDMSSATTKMWTNQQATEKWIFYETKQKWHRITAIGDDD